MLARAAHVGWRGLPDRARGAALAGRAARDHREDLSPAKVGTFDLVLFLGVLYHSQDPMRYLRNVRSIRRQIIVETHVEALDYPRPAVVFYPGGTLNGDPSNFWGRARAAVEGMLKEVGFSHVKPRTFWRPNRIVVHAFV